MENPDIRAEAAMDAYRNHFVGAGGRAARNVAHRFEATSNGEDSVIGFRGPYLQALDIANWSSDLWLSFSKRAGLHPLVRLAFEDIGFRRLYDFQERSIETILDGHDTVVTAATGRGKTEAWLIPILDYILNANQGKIEESNPDGVKAILTYPTKALAQDQLKRLIQYLYRINSELPTDDQITVGIYDGDTPSNMSSRAEGYLNATFKYFECPGFNESLEKCQNCGKSVHVRNAGQRYELEPEKKQCIDDVPLNFLRLTKNEILEEGVDILLTNPDTINLKLVNTNASDEHDAFIYEPQFYVFDEVHTYDGIFGSYTATLTKRIRALRANRGIDEPQVIASSATVENDVELFRRISGAADVEHVDENPRTINPPALDEVPRSLYDEQITATQLRQAARGETQYPTLLEGFDPSPDAPETLDNESLDDLLGDALFEYLTKAFTTDPTVQAVQNLHQALADEPRTRESFIADIQDDYGLRESQAQTVLDNFRTLGEYSGLLENRSHLISWPLDGFYACVQCTAVYRSPRDECANCDSGIVTRATYCRRCAEEALVAWYCPRCDQLESYAPSEEGSFASRDEQYCGRCQSARSEDIRLLRVTFTPELECQSCGSVESRSVVKSCTCDSSMARTAVDTWECMNPQCGRTIDAEFACSSCGSENRTLRFGDADVDCPSCGQTHDASVPKECSCGHSVANTRLIPWACTNDGCTREYFTQSPPSKCGCGSNRFVKRGLFEVFENERCADCDVAVLPGATCSCDDPELKPQADAFQSYQTVTDDGRVVPVRNNTSVVNCRHQRLGYRVGDRYDELVRSPNNIAVTTSQYLLREVADDESYSSAKMLSFADSHRDMKELDRDFNEPEVETLLDQALIESIRTSDETWVSLDDVLSDSLSCIDTLHDELSPPRSLQDVTFDLKDHLTDRVRRFMEPDEAIRDRLLRRAIPHSYSRRYRERGGSLAEDGLVDVRIDAATLRDLTGVERDILRGIVEKGNNCPADSIVSDNDELMTTVESLINRGILDSESEDYLSVNPSVLEMTVAGDGDNIQYVPNSGQFSPMWMGQVGIRQRDAVPFETALTDRADPSNSQFHHRAYRAEYSRARILIAKVYLGMTEKRERRELEYLFREGNYPHFLSSGPTMELGVDIGDLDALLLYGVPPNMNAYLQRVGRAGRSSHSSLVHSVSQRNPIDYYYYEKPTDLISADPKPVPLNEHNEEVLRVSLSWAVFDYIAANFVVPWEIEGWGPNASVSGGDNFKRRTDKTEDSDYGKLTHLMTLPVSRLGLNTDVSKLAALGTIVHDNKRQVREYLYSLLEYQYCTDCSAKYGRSIDLDTCEADNCDGRILDAVKEFGNLVDEAVESFQERYLDQYRTYQARLQDEHQELSQERTQLRRKKRRVSRDEKTRLRRTETAIAERIRALQEHLDTLESQSYSDFLQNARSSKFAFNMRNVSNNVGLTLVTEHDGTYDRREVGGNYGGRSVRMAIQELHPAAAYLDDGETYVVSHLRTDDFESSSLREAVSNTDAPQLGEEKVCSACHTSHPLSATECPCDHDASLKRRRLVAMNSVEAHRDDLLMSKGGDPARALYQQPEEEVQNTYAERETSVLEFDATQSFQLRDGAGTPIGTLEYGNYTVLTHTDSYRTKYKNGEIDPRPVPFEICGKKNCTGIIYRDEEDHAQCSADPEHSPNRHGADSEYVRLGYSYETSGIRVSLSDTEESHTFVHGLRVALQSLGGVNIREINETTDDGYVDLLDAQEGGANISKLLVERDADDFQNFRHAMELVRDHFVCDCEDGCPLCLYQYGCDEHNRPQSFARDTLLDHFADGLPAIAPTIDQQTSTEQ